MIVLATPLLPVAARHALAAGPQLRLENLDGAPYNDRLVMSRIQNPEDGSRRCFGNTPPECRIQPNVVHDIATLRLHNDGDEALTVYTLNLNGEFSLEAPPGLPAIVPPAQYLDVRVRFVAQDEGLRAGTYGGMLTIGSNDASAPTRSVQLAGFWQYSSEKDYRNPDPNLQGSSEPSVSELIRLFGYRFQLEGPWKLLGNQGHVEAVGDEVVSAYWRRADTGQPVTVRQLAAYHGQRTTSNPQNELISWYAKPTSTSVPTFPIFRHDGQDSQSVLPRLFNTSSAAAGQFTPSSEPFGFLAGNAWSDPGRNSKESCSNEATFPTRARAGHHLRWWPVRDTAGNLVPDTFWMIMDYFNPDPNAFVNYDFQDNVYLVSNIRPESATQGRPAGEPQALFRIDTGADYGRNFTDPLGRTWRSDESISVTRNADDTCTASVTALYAPVPMPDESPNMNPIAGAGGLDTMYRSYRGNSGAGQRLVTYNLPMGRSGRKVGVVLHFAERFWNEAGRRVFNVRVEGAPERQQFDIFAASGGKDTAYQMSFPDLTIADNTLTIELDATVPGSADYPSIAGIEVICTSLCTSAADLTPPAIPVNFRATGAQSGITLNWNAGVDADLKGYNVYRAGAPEGPFARLNATPLSKSATQYMDDAAASGVTSYYRLEALDTSNNPSSPATSSAYRPVGNEPTPTPLPPTPTSAPPTPTAMPSAPATPTTAPPTPTNVPPTPRTSPTASPTAGPRAGGELKHRQMVPMAER